MQAPMQSQVSFVSSLLRTQSTIIPFSSQSSLTVNAKEFWEDEPIITENWGVIPKPNETWTSIPQVPNEIWTNTLPFQ